MICQALPIERGSLLAIDKEEVCTQLCLKDAIASF